MGFSKKITFEFFIQVLGAVWILYHVLAGQFLLLGDAESCIIHINGAVLFTFLMKPMFKEYNNRSLPARTLNLAMAAAIVVAGVYIYIVMPEMLAGAIGKDFPMSIVLGFLTFFLILEGNRRLEGWIIPIIVAVALLYARFGEIMPDIFAHADFDAKRIVNLLYLGPDGIYGMIARVSFSYIGLFIIYAQFIRISGAGDFFLDFAHAVAGRVRGGPAKSAVVASSLFGMISGSAVANVAGVGSITIPLMKRSGYRAHIAGAIEAAASTGGQIMPPVMGASAFLMADFLRVSYFYVACCAAIPAFLYYLSLFAAVDLEAAKHGISGMKKEDIPNLKKVMKKGWHHCISLVVLIYLMAVPQWTATKAAFWALIALLIVSLVQCLIKKDNNFLRDIVWKGLTTSIDGVAMMGTISGALGIIVGIFGLTGLALKLSSIIIDLAGGSVPVLLILTMITSVMFGMGLPTIAAYVLLVIMVAPALEQLGIPLLVSHMFVFYFGCFSVLTPPVALASMAASSIAHADFWKTGWASARIAIVGFILPFAFVYNPQLLLQNPSVGMIVPIMATIIGVYALASGLTGYFLFPLNWLLRILAVVSAILLVDPGIYSSIAGIAILCFVFVPQIVRRVKYGKQPVVQPVQTN
jgi:TRAP transporter 4TM/12TM fusion protein